MTSKTLFDELRMKVLDMLKKKLPPNLAYHNYEHTLDVMHAAERIAKAEQVSEKEYELIRLAATLHDTGYITTRAEHEEESCRIAEKLLSAGGMNQSDIDIVCRLIRATKVPHQPQDKLSEILCDADLDYLGREDFFEIAHTVFLEFQTFGVVKDENEWNKLQIRFLETHKYFTPWSIKTRQPKKMEHLERLKEMVS